MTGLSNSNQSPWLSAVQPMPLQREKSTLVNQPVSYAQGSMSGQEDAASSAFLMQHRQRFTNQDSIESHQLFGSPRRSSDTSTLPPRFVRRNAHQFDANASKLLLMRNLYDEGGHHQEESIHQNGDQHENYLSSVLRLHNELRRKDQQQQQQQLLPDIPQQTQSYLRQMGCLERMKLQPQALSLHRHQGFHNTFSAASMLPDRHPSEMSHSKCFSDKTRGNNDVQMWTEWETHENILHCHRLSLNLPKQNCKLDVPARRSPQGFSNSLHFIGNNNPFDKDSHGASPEESLFREEYLRRQQVMKNVPTSHKRFRDKYETSGRTKRHPYFDILLNSENSNKPTEYLNSLNKRARIDAEMCDGIERATSFHPGLQSSRGPFHSQASAELMKKNMEAEKPRRPLTAYNLFFSEERERILALLPEPTSGQSDARNEGNIAIDKSNHSDKKEDKVALLESKMLELKKTLSEAEPLSKEDQRNLDLKIRNNTQKTLNIHKECDRIKKAHIKVHGKVAFQPLAKLIGERWRTLDAEKKKRYTVLAKLDKERYTAGMKAFNAHYHPSQI